MFAIEINPNSRTVKRLKFEPFEDWSENIYQLLGTWEWRHLCQFDNMDVMYTDVNGIKNSENCGFLFCESGEVIFGKAIIFGISKVDSTALVSCRFSVKEASELVVFCDMEESQIYREYKQGTAGQIDELGRN